MFKMIVYTKPKLEEIYTIIQPDFVVTLQLILFDNFKLKLCEIFYIFCIEAFEQQHFMVQKSPVPRNVNICYFSSASCVHFVRGSP